MKIYQLGVNHPTDIASGRAHIVRWTMVLRMTRTSQQECRGILEKKCVSTLISKA